MKTLNRWRDREGGFTLVELLVVILVIGILAAIAIPMFLNQRVAANTAKVKTDMRNAATAFETANITNFGKSAPTTGAAAFVSLPLAMVTSLHTAMTPEFHLSPGTTIDVATYNNDGSYCLVGTNPDSEYTDGAVATWDSEAGGLNKKGGACPATLIIGGVDNTGDAPVGGDEVASKVQTVAFGGTGRITEVYGRTSGESQTTLDVQFRDSDLSADELRAVAESATLASASTSFVPAFSGVNPSRIAEGDGYVTATFQITSDEGSLARQRMAKAFTLSFTDADGSTRGWKFSINTHQFNLDMSPTNIDFIMLQDEVDSSVEGNIRVWSSLFPVLG